MPSNINPNHMEKATLLSSMGPSLTCASMRGQPLKPSWEDEMLRCIARCVPLGRPKTARQREKCIVREMKHKNESEEKKEKRDKMNTK